jgi:hypothetical protein
MLNRWIHSRHLPVIISVIVAAIWRLWLMPRYAGWEESDYGNLAMIQGVLDSGFLHFDMNHMPGYYAVAALVHALVDDAVIAGRGVSWVGGLTALGLATALATRMGGARAGWVTGALLVIQPEFALYSSSSLREPLAAAFIVGAMASMSREKMAWAGLCAAGAFLVRFDSALVLVPVLVVHAIGRDERWRRLLRGLIPLVVAVFLWALYCRLDHGTWAFWSHSVSVNVETGMGAEAEAPGEWWLNGAEVSAALLAWLLPWRIGWAVWLGLIWVMVRSRSLGHGIRRTMALQGLLMLGLWAGIGFVGQHAPSHNLYWKWLCPIIPVVLPLAVVGLWEVVDRTERWMGMPGARVLLVVAVAQAAVANARETERQRARSEAWYRPQLELAQWIEEEVEPGQALVLDNIPACWIRRRATDRQMVSWFDVPVSEGDESGFAQWVRETNVRWVLWYREDWTQAPRIAPFLADGGRWSMDGVVLNERRREDGYGWIWYQVEP